jgi:hypothetical protein
VSLRSVARKEREGACDTRRRRRGNGIFSWVVQTAPALHTLAGVSSDPARQYAQPNRDERAIWWRVGAVQKPSQADVGCEQNQDGAHGDGQRP